MLFPGPRKHVSYRNGMTNLSLGNGKHYIGEIQED